jgi:hypothetical protein
MTGRKREHKKNVKLKTLHNSKRTAESGGVYSNRLHFLSDWQEQLGTDWKLIQIYFYRREPTSFFLLTAGMTSNSALNVNNKSNPNLTLRADIRIKIQFYSDTSFDL